MSSSGSQMSGLPPPKPKVLKPIDSTLTAADFLEQRGHEAPTVAVAAAAAVAAGEEELPAEGGPSLREQVEAFERGVIARALAATGGNQSEAARRLGTSRVTLIDKIKKYGLGTGGR